MSGHLQIAAGVNLSVDYVTKTAAILAQRRKGKTYTGAVIAEELYKQRLPWVALDPTGAWWGLRSSSDGNSGGIPCVVIGGQHADLPLERGAGAFIADLVLDHPGWYVLDVSLLESRSAEREFSTAFAKRLYRRKMQPGMDFPLHLFVDEADLFVPQEKEGRGDLEVLGAFQAIVRRGGLHGLGTTLISQRPALVNKSVLTQLDLLVLLRLVAGNDQDAVDKNYLSRAMGKVQRLEVMGSLASLPVGEGWFFEPGEDLLVRARVRERRTFNSSATPKPGERRVEPKVFAKVDLAELEQQMQDAVQRAREDDPVELRKMLRHAEADAKDGRAAMGRLDDVQQAIRTAGGADAVDHLANFYSAVCAAAHLPFSASLVEEARAASTLVEVPALSEEARRLLRDHVLDVENAADRTTEAYEKLREVLVPLAANLEDAFAAGDVSEVGRRRRAREQERVAVERTQPRPPTAPPAPPQDSWLPASENGNLSSSGQKILDALAWYRAFGIQTPTKQQVGFVAGYNAKGGRFGNLLGELRRDGYIEYPRAGEIELTSKGSAVARDPGLPRTREALHEAVLNQLPGSEAKVLAVVLERYPGAVSRDELGDATGYEPRGGRFGNILGRLSSLGLTHYPQQGMVAAREVLFP